MTIRVALLLVSALAPSGFVAQAETLSEALAKCSQSKDNAERLACYDNVAKTVNQYSDINKTMAMAKESTLSAQANEKANEKTVQTSPKLNDDLKSQFGLEHKVEVKKLMDSLAGTVTKITKTARDKMILRLDDGSVWQQTSDTSLRVKEGQNVIIERGMLGAFYAKAEGLNRRMKVKRIY